MRVSVLMAGLYPPAVRDRWGAEISRQVAETGIRSWPDAVTGAARLWIHPSDWPETLTGQTRRVLAVALFAVLSAAVLLLRATAPSAMLTADVGHPVTSAWLVPILLGIGLATPLPRLGMLQRLTVTAVRTLAGPALAVLALYATARSGLVEHPTGAARVALIAGYWATLGFTALRLCTLVARVARTAAMPGTRRLCAALLLLGAGLALATSQSLLAVAQTAPRAGSIAVTFALGVLAVVTVSAGHDLYDATTRLRR
jgi:hypothetical protein